MLFEWDEVKRRRNIEQHGVDFIDIAPLFEGRTLEIVDDRTDYGETRIIGFGELSGRLYAVVYTRRGSNLRIISARKANAREQRAYDARYT